MKIARFSHGESISFGIVDEEEDELVVLKADPMFPGSNRPASGSRSPTRSCSLP